MCKRRNKNVLIQAMAGAYEGIVMKIKAQRRLSAAQQRPQSAFAWRGRRGPTWSGRKTEIRAISRSAGRSTTGPWATSPTGQAGSTFPTTPLAAPPPTSMAGHSPARILDHQHDGRIAGPWLWCALPQRMLQLPPSPDARRTAARGDGLNHDHRANSGQDLSLDQLWGVYNPSDSPSITLHFSYWGDNRPNRRPTYPFMFS